MPCRDEHVATYASQHAYSARLRRGATRRFQGIAEQLSEMVWAAWAHPLEVHEL
jgi:hypothetical protein